MDILQSIVLCHADSSYDFSAQALETEGARWRKKGLTDFSSPVVPIQVIPWMLLHLGCKQWFPTYSIILLFANHLHHPPVSYLTPRGLPGLGGPLALQELSSEQMWYHINTCVVSSSAMALWDPHFQFLNISCSEVRVLVCKTPPGLPASGWQSLFTYLIFGLCETYSWPVVSEDSNVFHWLWRQNPVSH